MLLAMNAIAMSLAVKVFLVTCEYPPFPGGIATYCGGLVGALEAAGVEVEIAAPHYPEFAGLELDRDNVHRIFGHHNVSPEAALKLITLLRGQPAGTLVLAADIRSVAILYATALLHRKSYRVMVHGSEASKFSGGSVVHRILRRAYLFADVVLYNSEATGRIFRNAVGNPRNECVTYLGVDPYWFSSPQTSEFENEELQQLAQDRIVFCSTGRIEPRKGQLETVQALAQAKERHCLTDVVYCIAGRVEDAGYAARVEHEAEQLGVPVLFLGRLSDDDLKRLYQRSVCHILFAQSLPGKVEGFGLVLLEAAAQGCPSIASNTGGIPEVIGDDEAIVASDGIEELGRILARIAMDIKFREELSKTASSNSREFSWRKCASLSFAEFSLN